MHYEESGAYTGETSPLILSDTGVKYVIIGHSERRQYFNETDETVNKKLHAAFKYDLIPILCVGEHLEERENNTTNQVVYSQTKKALEGLNKEQVKKLSLLMSQFGRLELVKQQLQKLRMKLVDIFVLLLVSYMGKMSQMKCGFFMVDR